MRPNILIFMTDQQRGDTTLAGARAKAKTPNLDAFARQGVTFSNTFCPSPHCCPSRATFLSGLYPSQHGVWNNVSVGNTLSRGLTDGVRLWSEDFRDAGYEMMFSGKWHVSSEETPVDRGWGMVRQPRAELAPEPGDRRPAPHMREWEPYRRLAAQGQPQAAPVRGEAQILRPGYGTYTHYGTNENPFRDRNVVDEALEIMRTRGDVDRPWCQYVGTLGPHDPYFVPQRFLDMYDPNDVTLPPTFEDRMSDKPALYRRTRDRFDQLSEREHREAIRHYLAFCSYQDALFGELLDALEATGQADNTIVVYVSDHGDYMSDHGLWCKGLPCFRAAYHVPALVRWPKGIQAPGRVVDEFVSLADFAPTFMDAAGLEYTPNRFNAGQSLMPFLRNEVPESWRDAVFTQSNGNELYGIQRSIMTREWKYVYNGFDYDELYDLSADPDETRNLAADPAQDAVKRALCRRLWEFAYAQKDVCINGYIMVGLAPYGPGEAFLNTGGQG